MCAWLERLLADHDRARRRLSKFLELDDLPPAEATRVTMASLSSRAAGQRVVTNVASSLPAEPQVTVIR
jgi:hypothetical protein